VVKIRVDPGYDGMVASWGLFCLLQACCFVGIDSPVSSIPGNLLRGLVCAWNCENNGNFLL
jgi:hypothetical protein